MNLDYFTVHDYYYYVYDGYIYKPSSVREAYIAYLNEHINENAFF